MKHFTQLFSFLLVAAMLSTVFVVTDTARAEETTVTIDCLPASAYLSKTGSVYADVRASTAAATYTTPWAQDKTVMNFLSSGTWYVDRIIYAFDLSSIPADAQITSVVIRLASQSVPGGTTQLYIQQVNSYTGTASDYDQTRYSSEYTVTTASVLANPGTNNNPVTLDNSLITPGGTSALVLRHEYDYENTASSNSGFKFYGTSAGTTRITQLQITYSEAAASTWAASFTSTPEETGTVGEEYSYTPGCNESVAWSLDNGPEDCDFFTDDGSILWTPTAAGDFDFSLKATSTAGTLPTWQNWTVTVSEAIPVPVITGDPDTNATKRVWYSFQPSVDLANCYWTVTGAGWLSINQYSGKVSGLPTSAGTYHIAITALSTDYGTNATLAYDLTVADLLDPPADNGDDTTDPGGDDPGTSVTGISERMALTALVLVIAGLVAVVLLARRH